MIMPNDQWSRLSFSACLAKTRQPGTFQSQYHSAYLRQDFKTFFAETWVPAADRRWVAMQIMLQLSKSSPLISHSDTTILFVGLISSTISFISQSFGWTSSYTRSSLTNARLNIHKKQLFRFKKKKNVSQAAVHGYFPPNSALSTAIPTMTKGAKTRNGVTEILLSCSVNNTVGLSHRGCCLCTDCVLRKNAPIFPTLSPGSPCHNVIASFLWYPANCAIEYNMSSSNPTARPVPSIRLSLNKLAKGHGTRIAFLSKGI
jgi:hypothetical protein